MMDINEVREYLPHRYPFLLVDRVVNVEPGKRIEAYKNVTINEPFFNGHFPQEPIMPGVLIIEAMGSGRRDPRVRHREQAPGGWLHLPAGGRGQCPFQASGRAR